MASYLYFNQSGVLCEFITGAARSGDDDNTVYAFLSNIGTLTGVSAFVKHNTTSGTVVTDTEILTTSTAIAQVPYDQYRDLNYFKYYTDYTFYKLTLSASKQQTTAGLCTITFSATTASGTVACGVYNLYFEPTSVALDDSMTLSNFYYLSQLLESNFIVSGSAVTIGGVQAYYLTGAQNTTPLQVYSALRDGNGNIISSSYLPTNSDIDIGAHRLTAQAGDFSEVYISDSLKNATVYVDLPSASGTMALVSQIPTDVSDLINDAGYVTALGSVAYATSAGSAVKDGSGNTISTYYATASALAAKQDKISAGTGISIAGTVVSVSDGVFTAIDTKQNKLTAGTGIDITNNVISSTSSVTVDSALSTSSVNPVQNKVITEALNAKQALLSAGTGISIANNTVSASLATLTVKKQDGTTGTYNGTASLDLSDGVYWANSAGNATNCTNATYASQAVADNAGHTISAYFAPVSSLSAYMPLSGGTFTNNVTMSNGTYLLTKGAQTTVRYDTYIQGDATSAYFSVTYNDITAQTGTTYTIRLPSASGVLALVSKTIPLGTLNGTGSNNLAGGTGSVVGVSGQNYSNMTAYGVNAKAVNDYSTASGSFSTASGSFSTASGYFSTASGTGSTASGDYSTASGTGSTASGSISTASGTGSTASGSNSTASGTGSTAIGCLYLSSQNFGSYNNIENSVTFDGQYASAYPTVHPNAIIHFGYLSNIYVRNSDQTSTSASVSDITTAYPNAKSLQYYFDQKQDTLVSGTNIKTINGSSVLGTGDLAISGTVTVSTLTNTGTVDIPLVDTDYTITATVTAPAGYFAGVATTSTSYENCTPTFSAVTQTRAMQNDGSTKVTVTCSVMASSTQSGQASLTLSLKVANIAS